MWFSAYTPNEDDGCRVNEPCGEIDGDFSGRDPVKLVVHEGRRRDRRAQRHAHRVRPLHARAARHGGEPRRAREPPRRHHRRRVGRRRALPLRRRDGRRDRRAAQRGRLVLAQGCAQQDVPHEGDAPRRRREELLPEDEGRGHRAQRALLVRSLHRHRRPGHGHLHPGHQPQGGGAEEVERKGNDARKGATTRPHTATIRRFK